MTGFLSLLAESPATLNVCGHAGIYLQFECEWSQMENVGMKIGGSQLVWLCVQQDKYQIEFFIKERMETLPAMQRKPEYDLESIKEYFRPPLASGEKLRVVNVESASCVALLTSDSVVGL